VKIEYDAPKKTLTVDGVVFHNVSVNAYYAFQADPNPEHHFQKYIGPVYLREDQLKQLEK
jgi:hypothetical protein